MPVTTAEIIEEFQTILSGITVTVIDPEGTPSSNPETGALEEFPTTQKTALEAYTGNELNLVISSLVTAILNKIESEGIIMGDSTATKLEVS